MKDSMAAFNKVSNNVARVDLTKQWVPHQEITELDLGEQLDEQIFIENGSY